MNPDTPSPNAPSSRRSPLLFGACLLCAIVVVAAVALTRTAEPAAGTPAALAALPVRQLELVHAEPFRVEQPFHHVWRGDQPLVDRGWLLVLAGDPAQMVPRQTLEPVLCVGAQTADRVNTGQGSGKLVVIVPGDFWLEDAPIFYGGEALPEEVRQPWIDRELANARAAGAVAPTAELAAQVAGPARTFPTDYQLRLRAIDLVEQYSPGEKDLIAGWRVPLVK